MTANPSECSFHICSEDSQSTLHDENETPTINGTLCQAILCNTAHDCEIRDKIPWKHSIAAEAQRLRPKHSSTHAVTKANILFAELQFPGNRVQSRTTELNSLQLKSLPASTRNLFKATEYTQTPLRQPRTSIMMLRNFTH